MTSTVASCFFFLRECDFIVGVLGLVDIYRKRTHGKCERSQLTSFFKINNHFSILGGRVEHEENMVNDECNLEFSKLLNMTFH